MDRDVRDAICRELAEAFGELTDVTPSDDQPLHVLLRALELPRPWVPSPARGLAVFNGWPAARPDFYIDVAVVNSAGEPPRSNSEQLVVGGPWRQFSYGFEWPQERASATRALQLWLTRFREST